MSIGNIQNSVTKMSIPGLQGIKSSTSTTTATDVTNQVFDSFGKILENLEKTEQESDQLLKKLSAGEDVDMHQVMLAAEKTDISYKVAMGLRDRLVEAYKEIRNMTV
jgi:flagellar hook-basal body complex protein FliE